MQSCCTVLKAGILITQNDSREILHNAAIAVDNGLIVDIDSRENIFARWTPGQILDYSNMLVMPGLINAHTHAAMTFLRGRADDIPLMDWLRNVVFPIEARLDPEIVHLATLLGHAEMLACGTTACIDMYMHEEAVLSAAETVGIRCMGGEAIFSFPSAACETPQEALAKTAALARKYRNHPRISIAVNPHSVYTTSPRLLEECTELALSENIPLHIHLAETETETSQSIALYGKRPVECALDIIGATPIIAAHLVDITAAEAVELGKRNVVGVHNPTSNMKLASGAAPVETARKNGLIMALGTDGAASNNQLNMFMEMRGAALLQKLCGRDPSALPAGTVLDMATRNGAKCMRNDKIGSLETGKAADCIAIDLSKPNLLPMHNPVSQIVYAATGHECAMTMIGGEIVYRDGVYPRFDYEGLVKEVARLKSFVERHTKNAPATAQQ